MPVLQIGSLQAIKAAIEAVSHVHGGYQAMDLLAKAMSDVEEPDGFDSEVRQAEDASGMRYEGPENATRTAPKTLETAANEATQNQSALVELLALVLIKLGSLQGSKLLVGLLAIVGVKPVLAAVFVRLLLMLVQSETGRRIVMEAWPKMSDRVGVLWQTPQLQSSLKQVSGALGEEGSKWLNAVAGAPKTALDAATSAADSLFEGIEGITGVRLNRGEGPSDDAAPKS